MTYIGSLGSFTNDEDWTQEFTITDEDGDLTDVTSITLNVQNRTSRSSELTGTLADGKITRIGLGTYQWSFSADDVSDLNAETYNVGITVVLAGATTQLFAGTVAVLDGFMN